MDDVSNREWRRSDNKGRDDADALIRKIKAERATPLLGFAVKSMMTAGTFGAYEIGFFQRIAEGLLAGA